MFCTTAKTENEGLHSRADLLHPTLIKRKLIVASLRVSEAAANGSPGHHKERERASLHALFSSHLQSGTGELGWGAHCRLLRLGQVDRDRTPDLILPSLTSSGLHPPPPAAQRWYSTPEPSTEAPPTLTAPSSLKLAGVPQRNPKKTTLKESGPLQLRPHSVSPAGLLREKWGRRGLGAARGEPGRGVTGERAHEKLMPPCRLLIFVCFSLFARREASFISPDCHYPALNFHRAGREAGQGEAGRGAARALGGPVGLSPAPRGPCLHTASLNCSHCFSPSLSVAFDLPAAHFGGFSYSHFTVKKLRLCPTLPLWGSNCEWKRGQSAPFILANRDS